MVLIYYLGKTIELTIEEYEQIMRCPNYIYIYQNLDTWLKEQIVNSL